jgi:hypothetical protein
VTAATQVSATSTDPSAEIKVFFSARSAFDEDVTFARRPMRPYSQPERLFAGHSTTSKPENVGLLSEGGLMLTHINNFLDRHVLPWPVRFLTFRFVILATIGLLIPLILFADNTVLVLGLNSYLNTMSVAVGSIVLLYATIAEVRQKQIVELQEQRAQEGRSPTCDRDAHVGVGGSECAARGAARVTTRVSSFARQTL